MGSQAFHTFPPAPLSPAPTWAYPCSLLLLPILAESAPPRHLDLHTCRGPGWEAAGAAAAERSAHTRRYPAPPGPPTAASAPHPAAPSPVSTIFYTKKDGGGTRRALGRCFRSVIASPRSSPQPTFCSSQTRAIVGRGGCGPCAASPGAAGPPAGLREPRGLSHTKPRERSPSSRSLTCFPFASDSGPASGAHAFRATGSRQREVSERGPI